MHHLDVLLDFDVSKLLLDITHGLFILLAFLDILEKGMLLTLPSLIDFAGNLLVLQMFCCVFNGTFESLASADQGTNRSMIVH